MKNLISIIIPTRNRKKYVKDLISDIDKQILPESYSKEIIVADQSDTRSKINNCEYYYLDSTGPCVSRNFAAKRAQGEILVFLDDDARIENNFIYEITKPIITNITFAVAGAVCDINGKYPKDDKEFLKKDSFNFLKVLTANPNNQNSGFCMSFPGCCAAIVKNVFNDLGGFDEKFDPTGAGEDRDLAMNLFSNGYGIYYNHLARLFHIGVGTGGSRDVGSRSLYLEINTHKICLKYFSVTLSENLEHSILSGYKYKLLRSALRIKGLRTNYINYQHLKRELAIS
jgi:glycosyltransferase involved in cell wall biosynthesis